MMDFIIKTFRSHLSNLLFFSVLFSIVSIISESSLLSIVVGISLIAPLQISILSGGKTELSQLIDNVICRDSLYYTVLYWATWVLPIIGGGLILLVIVDDSNFLTAAGMAVYAFFYAKMSPMLVRIATGHWGKKLLFRDMMGITLSMWFFGVIEYMCDYVGDINGPLAVISIFSLSTVFVLTFSLQSAIVLRRNELSSVEEKG